MVRELDHHLARVQMENGRKQQPARSPRHLRELAVWSLAGVPVVALLLAPRPEGLLWENLFNAAHVATSFLLGLACLRLSRQLFAHRFRSSWMHYLVSLGLVAAVGSGVEGLQYIVPGTPSISDLGRDLLGGLAIVLAALSFDQQTIPLCQRE